MFIRVLNVLLGVWLFLSAFLWPHPIGQFHNTWLLGVLVAFFGVAAIFGVAWARFVNFGLALWLFFSTVIPPGVSGGTAVNNILVAVGIIITSLFPVQPRVYRASEAPTPV